jgi:hypothetical protein
MITKEKKKEYARRDYLKRKEYIKKKSLEYHNRTSILKGDSFD